MSDCTDVARMAHSICNLEFVSDELSKIPDENRPALFVGYSDKFNPHSSLIMALLDYAAKVHPSDWHYLTADVKLFSTPSGSGGRKSLNAEQEKFRSSNWKVIQLSMKPHATKKPEDEKNEIGADKDLFLRQLTHTNCVRNLSNFFRGEITGGKNVRSEGDFSKIIAGLLVKLFG